VQFTQNCVVVTHICVYHTQMARKLTSSDIEAVTGYTRNQARGLLDRLPRYANAPRLARVAQEYSPHDLLAVSVAACLERTHRLQRAAIAEVFDAIYEELRGPRPQHPSPLLHVTFEPPAASYLTEQQAACEGIMVALGPIFGKVDSHLGIAPPQQHDMFPVTSAIGLVRKRG
jgi:hypothetical protein